MVLRVGRFLFWVLALLPMGVSYGEDPKRFVQQAVQSELGADGNDHSLWLYFETDRKPGRSVTQWVAQARGATLNRVIEMNGQPVPEPEQRKKMDTFVRDSWSQSKQRKSEQHDDQQATEMLDLLPQAFVWRYAGKRGDDTILHFRPDPQFRPPDFQAKVFAAMEGDMEVDNEQHRIVSLKGRLIQDVKILGGILGSLNAGGTFDVERRQTGKDIWQITETHVHIQGHAMIFKTISEQEDDVKSQFRQLPGNTTVQQAERDLLAQRK